MRRILPIALAALLLPAATLAGEGAVVTASSVHSSPYRPEYALDGNGKTRWASSEFRGRPEWLAVSLGKRVEINSIEIKWEAAYATVYEVQVSDDGKQWRTVRRVENGRGGVVRLAKLGAAGSHLRILCHAHGRHPLFSIWELTSPDPKLGAVLAERYAARLKAERKAAAASRAELSGALLKHGVSEVVYVERHNGVDGHWYGNFAYYAASFDRKAYRDGSCLRILDVKTGEVRDVLEDPRGTIRDPCVHYDAKRILFSYRPGGEFTAHLYEIGVDGKGLRQLTRGIYDDIEPTYLPDGGIAFVSGRAKRWVNCWLTQVAVLHRCDADGSNIRQLSANIEHDNTPWVLPDGRILYTRWEYVDRSQVHYHHLWTVNPDGTNHAAYYGNFRPGQLFIDAKPVPGTDRVVISNSPGHGRREHEGHVAVCTPEHGPDDPRGMRNLTRGSNYRDPWAFSERAFMAARGRDILLINDKGAESVVLSGRNTVHEPRPLIARKRERVVPSRVDVTKTTGTLLIGDVRLGRKMEGVKPGEITKLLVLETLPKPINYTGGMDPMSYGGTFTLERIVGTVPVEPDGSAHFELPADRAFFFVALDENNLSVKRMQSFLSVAPGETTSCVGCHESRTQAMPPIERISAAKRPPSKVTPVAHVPDVIDFPRDVQPVLDRHCVRCHGYEKPAGGAPSKGPYAGGVILTGDRGPMFSHSYFTLTIRRQ
ncbi:MAG: HzsA-related protein, partial [Planctomycetota bacterium]